MDTLQISYKYWWNSTRDAFSDTQSKTKMQLNQNTKENTLLYALLSEISPNHKDYLNSYIMMKNADQKDMFHHQSRRHGNCGHTGIHENIGQSFIHVLPAVGHVELFHLPTNGGQIRFTQPIEKQNPAFTFSYLYTVP